MDVLAGSTDVTTYFVLRLAADGTEATGLTITDFDLQYVRSGAAPAAKVDATALAATDSAHGDNQAIEIDATDQPGLYRVDWPDAAFASGVREVILSVKCATAFTEHLRVNLTAQPANVTHFGGTAGTFSSGRPEVNTSHWAGTAVGSTEVRANLINIAGSAVNTSTAQLGVNVVNAAGTAWGSGAITAASIASDAITSAKIATGAIDADAIASDAVTEIQSGLSTLTAANVQTECEEALQTYHLDHLIHSADPGGVVANSSFIAKLVSKSATPAFSSYDNTTDSLEALRDNVGTAGAGLTAADDAVITAIGALNNITAASVWAVGTRTLTSLSGLTVDTVTTLTNLPAITANWLTAAGLATDAVSEIADGVLARNVSNVEASAGEHTLCTMVLAGLESSRSGTTWTIKRTDGSTTHATKTLTVDADADPITGVS